MREAKTTSCRRSCSHVTARASRHCSSSNTILPIARRAATRASCSVMRPAADRAEGRIASTRIAEVENAGTPEEREKPVGHDGGYLWRLNTYWRLLTRDGGVYIQCESVSLTRGIPLGLGWIVGPFVTSIPRESLTFTLETTRRELEKVRR